MTTPEELTPIFRKNASIMEAVYSRIHYKMRDYAAYRFTAPQSCAINIFFDLAQEFTEIEQLHMLAVLILKMFFQYEAELYLKDGQDSLILVTPAVNPEIIGIPELRPEIWSDSARCYIPVRGRNSLVVTRNQRIVAGHDLMGVLVLYSSKEPASHDLLFLEKFANRVGFCLHNKILADRNSRHILFVRKLAHDIGHNIITPNMRLKLLLNQLEGQIASLDSIAGPEHASPKKVDAQDIRVVQRKMSEQIKDIMGTFKNSALFLESLLRQSHFDLGHYVLRRSRLDMRTLVVLPQFERYRSHFTERSLNVDNDQPIFPQEPCMVQADLGLISQVLANLLSNAVKYGSLRHNNAPGEVRCKVEIIPTAFGINADGVKVSVFSSGPHIPKSEAHLLFTDSFRASNASGLPGTGHGLFFVREIVAEHGGKTGYEPVMGGNIFYFMLPRVE